MNEFCNITQFLSFDVRSFDDAANILWWEWICKEEREGERKNQVFTGFTGTEIPSFLCKPNHIIIIPLFSFIPFSRGIPLPFSREKGGNITCDQQKFSDRIKHVNTTINSRNYLLVYTIGIISIA